MVYFIWTWIQNPTVVMNRFQMNAIWLVRRHARTLARNPPKIQPMDPVLAFLTKGRSYIVRSCKKDHIRFLYEYAVVWIQNTVNVGSFKTTAPLNRIFEEIRFIKKSTFFFLIMFLFFSVSVNILTTAVLHFLTWIWRNKKLGRALSTQVEPW